MNESEERRLSNLGFTENNVLLRLYLSILFIFLLTLSLEVLILNSFCLLNVYTITISIIVFVFSYILIFGYMKTNGVVWLLTHPIWFRLITKSNFKFIETDLTKVDISDLNIDDTIVVDNYRTNYIIRKFVFPIYILFSLFSIILLSINSTVSVFIFLLLCRGLCIGLAVAILFYNSIFDILYKNYYQTLSCLYEEGYITNKQFKALHFYDSYYIGVDNLLSEKDCDYVLNEDINSLMILNKVNDFKFSSIDCRIFYSSVLFLLSYLVIFSSLYMDVCSVVVWFLFVIIYKKLLSLIKLKIQTKIKRHPNRYMNNFKKDISIMNFFIIRTLPLEKIMRI